MLPTHGNDGHFLMKKKHKLGVSEFVCVIFPKMLEFSIL